MLRRTALGHLSPATFSTSDGSVREPTLTFGSVPGATFACHPNRDLCNPLSQQLAWQAFVG
ncbi:hypothetical protein [Allorhodopirellula heiligendammensis]|uniref:hypothetical protein n=1 Tax=Allorhodopirellula heiligendammensis TaxID=2714739 RepID=UPI00265EB869|nr:hypothetical protein [Allorhodopirellula heiligendammensis]